MAARLSNDEAVNKIRAFLQEFHGDMFPCALVGEKKVDRE
jgi:hypothetical protein